MADRSLHERIALAFPDDERLSVENSGPHVAHYDVPSLFQPSAASSRPTTAATTSMDHAITALASNRRACRQSPRRMGAPSPPYLERTAASQCWSALPSLEMG